MFRTNRNSLEMVRLEDWCSSPNLAAFYPRKDARGREIDDAPLLPREFWEFYSTRTGVASVAVAATCAPSNKPAVYGASVVAFCCPLARPQSPGVVGGGCPLSLVVAAFTESLLALIGPHTLAYRHC